MSFKREGDDISQLNVLRKRRVEDLLSSYIPEDEALLLKNGRYACTVCSYRPVFDTLDMLTVHRSGKKHIASLQSFYGKKRELENEVEKRQHKAFLQGEEAIKSDTSGPAPLLTQTRKITHNALLKATPYNSCCKVKRPLTCSQGTGSSSSVAASSLYELKATKAPALIEKPHALESTSSQELPGCRVSQSGEQEKAAQLIKKSSMQVAENAVPVKKDEVTPEKRRMMQHYLKLKSSGWIQDKSGKWVKDENVEFDSDEEEPPSFLPS
ncbi:sodium channel modifier 1-like [Protopterus annectens]|uniref:sodium channel modifier 1-like n=1 Tax=Protopterus annectens TaxID=7888 RepID=UPI001CFAE4A5|nr:sodium channel modifier 1-like [Protopterus annectens]